MLYQRAPMTASTAAFLARVYGAPSVDELARSLPAAARVLDVGAGYSELGQVVARLRPDIAWTNLDLNYPPGEVRADNLTHVQGDVLANTSRGPYDRIYAFWVLPHIGLEGTAMIEQALTNMLRWLTPDGRLVVGPLLAHRTGSAATNYLTATLAADAADIARIAHASSVPSDQVWFYRAMNRAGLMTIKNGERTGQTPTRLGLWEFATRRYVDVRSARGLYLCARFGIFLAVEKLRSLT